MTQTPPKKSRAWSKTALVISIALNLLVLGAVAGHFLRPDDKPPRGQGVELSSLAGGPIGAALTREERRQIGAGVFRRSGEFRGRRENLREASRELAEYLRRDDFDPDEFRGYLASIEKNAADMRGQVTDGFVQLVAGMSAEERLGLADRLEKTLRRRRRRE